ncbi:hypothetical protein Slala05_29990 [Streptomyces lavendulae subsp. lavendulae]|nr:hypothetical protein Slala05_29990 [Streptomyces lavendulae subsp. lavendulae]
MRRLDAAIREARAHACEEGGETAARAALAALAGRQGPSGGSCDVLAIMALGTRKPAGGDDCRPATNSGRRASC